MASSTLVVLAIILVAVLVALAGIVIGIVAIVRASRRSSAPPHQLPPTAYGPGPQQPYGQQDSSQQQW
ncbi:hypothetical protein [Microlunatus sp. Y2014]|uniref:hypothetical protein n=1 Tax=Microlunatus sp. Y2014 TaxID=3418488 RepID=UPI003DA6DD93